MDYGKSIYMDYTVFSYEAAQLPSAVATEDVKYETKRSKEEAV